MLLQQMTQAPVRSFMRSHQQRSQRYCTQVAALHSAARLHLRTTCMQGQTTLLSLLRQMNVAKSSRPVREPQQWLYTYVAPHHIEP